VSKKGYLDFLYTLCLDFLNGSAVHGQYMVIQTRELTPHY
jgi:hypothetical protein